MADTTGGSMSGPGPGRPASAGAGKKTGKSLLWAFVAVVVAFAAGFLWQYYEASTVRAQLEATEQELRIERLRVGLAQAAVAAQSGDFEEARQQMSQFFTRLQSQELSLPEELAGVADEFLTTRDEVIAGLARSNPDYAGVLYGMLDRFRAAAPGPGAPGAGTAGEATDGAGRGDTTAP